MQDIVVRKATLEDLASLNGFQQGIADAERLIDPAIKDGAVQYYDIARMLTADDTYFVVAQAGTRAVACGYARIEPAKHYLKHSVHAYLGLMYVDPNYRGRSLNLAIIAALKDWSLSRGVGELRLEVYRDNVAAIKAYEKAGFSQWVVEMRWGQNDGAGS
jgi:GNAT superfamily N-acetyltransferase